MNLKGTKSEKNFAAQFVMVAKIEKSHEERYRAQYRNVGGV